MTGVIPVMLTETVVTLIDWEFGCATIYSWQFASTSSPNLQWPPLAKVRWQFPIFTTAGYQRTRDWLILVRATSVAVPHADRRLVKDEIVATGARAPAKLLDMEHYSGGKTRVPVQKAATAVDPNHVESMAGCAVDLAQHAHLFLSLNALILDGLDVRREHDLAEMRILRGRQSGRAFERLCLLVCCTTCLVSQLLSSPLPSRMNG